MTNRAFAAIRFTRARCRLCVWAALVCLSTGLATRAVAAETVRVRVNPGVVYQTMDGFGASDAWQCQFVGKNWPLEKRERMADLLFSRELDTNGSPKGIGLSIWRFNIGAGTTEQGDASGIRNPWRRAECFQNADGSYDWSKQAGQQWFLDAARRRGVERFLAFPNAAPVHLSRNGKGFADKGPPQFNLKPDKVDAYAAFLAEVLAHFQQAGRGFDYLSPFNEPQWAWDDGGQEGTPALNVELYDLIRALSKELARRKLTTQMVIGEAGTIGHALRKMDTHGLVSDGRDDQAQFFFNPKSAHYIGDLPNVAPVISAHDYHSVWPLDKLVEYRQALRDALHSANPKLGYWQSEYCILEEPNDEIRGGRRRDLGMDTALYVARLIHVDLTVANARSWQWWTAISQVDFKDGLLYLDDGSAGASGRMGPRTRSLMADGAVRESKLLWAFGNFSRFIRPGAVRVQCETSPGQPTANGLLASAYRGPAGEVVTVLVNLSTDDVTCDLGVDKTVDVFITSDATSLGRTRQPAAQIKLPARSVGTVLLGKD